MKMISFMSRTNYILLFLIAITLPFFLYYYYNGLAENTYKKDYYLIKSGDYEYVKYIKLKKYPIINEESVKDFITESMIGVFNYRPNVAIRQLEDYQEYFSGEAYEFFLNGFIERVNKEIDSGIVINEMVVMTRPVYLGNYTYSGGGSSLYYLIIREMKTGETGNKLYSTSEVFVEVIAHDFGINKKGLSIKNISIR